MAFVICAALTVAGLLAAWQRWRRKSPRAGVRMLAWALVPMAFYLTGLATLAERLGSAFTRFFASFVFSGEVWSGVVLAGLALVLMVVSGGLPKVSRRKSAKAKASTDAQGGGSADRGREPAPALTRGRGRTVKQAQAEPDDDMADIQEILRRRGIS
jgi:hypothetical protein